MMKQDRRLNYFEMKRKILYLQQLLKRNAEPQEYLPILKLMVNNVRCLMAVPIINDYYYRGRVSKLGRLFNNLSEITYPRKEIVKVKGRLNDVGETILYASNSELGTLVEMDLERYSFFTIATIKLIDRGIYFVPLGITGKDYSPVPQTKAEELLINYFNTEITKIISNHIEYNPTIALAHLFLNDPVINCKMGKMAGIIYPSSKSKNMSNKVTYNIAIQPEIFDSCYIFGEIYVYCMTHEKNHPQIKESFWQMTGVNKVVSISTDGTLNWLYNFEEMKDRISKGLIVEGGTCDNLKGMEKYL